MLLLATGAETLFQQTLREGAAGLVPVHVYPALDLFVAVVAVLALAHAGVGQRGPLWLISAAFVLRELSDIALAYQVESGRFDAGVCGRHRLGDIADRPGRRSSDGQATATAGATDGSGARRGQRCGCPTCRC